jgi:hypothetical protein
MKYGFPIRLYGSLRVAHSHLPGLYIVLGHHWCHIGRDPTLLACIS